MPSFYELCAIETKRKLEAKNLVMKRERFILAIVFRDEK
jgi:hypothetical protein